MRSRCETFRTVSVSVCVCFLRHHCFILYSGFIFIIMSILIFTITIIITTFSQGWLSHEWVQHVCRWSSAISSSSTSHRCNSACPCVCVSAHKQKKVEAFLPCDTAYPGFMYDPSVREANSLIKCGRCQKYVTDRHTHLCSYRTLSSPPPTPTLTWTTNLTSNCRSQTLHLSVNCFNLKPNNLLTDATTLRLSKRCF